MCMSLLLDISYPNINAKVSKSFMSILEYLLILDACISCAGLNLLLGLIYIYHQNAKKKMQIAILMRQN